MKQKKKQQVQKVPLQSFPRAACMRMQREVGEVLPPLVLTGPAVTVTLPGDENMSRTTDGRRLSAFTQVLKYCTCTLLKYFSFGYFGYITCFMFCIWCICVIIRSCNIKVIYTLMNSTRPSGPQHADFNTKTFALLLSEVKDVFPFGEDFSTFHAEAQACTRASNHTRYLWSNILILNSKHLIKI